MITLSQEEIKDVAMQLRIEVLTTWLDKSQMSMRDEKLILNIRERECLVDVKCEVKRTKKNHRVENWDLPTEGEYNFIFNFKSDIEVIDVHSHDTLVIEKSIMEEAINFLNQ